MIRLLDELHRHRRALAAADARVERRLAVLYRRALAPVQHEIDELVAKMATWQREHPGEHVPTSWLNEEMRLHRLHVMIQRQADAYAQDVQRLTMPAMHAAAQSGAADALALLQTTVPRGFGAHDWTFGRPNPRALDALTQQPLHHLFASWGSRASQGAQRLLFADLALGRGPRGVARDLVRLFGSMTYSRALTVARTSTIRAYSAASLASYRANSDVVESWIWVADLSGACAACVAMNGSEHALSEDLDDHPNGRCVKVPKTKSWGDILGQLGEGFDTRDIPETQVSVPSGSDWFDEQSAAQQRAIFGSSAAYRAYLAGSAALGDFVRVRHDAVWGDSIYQSSLRQLGLDASDYAEKGA